MSSPQQHPPENFGPDRTPTTQQHARSGQGVVTVSPTPLKLVLEQLGYTVLSESQYCWVLARGAGLPLVIPRLGRAVDTDILYSTLAKVRVTPKQFFRMCQLVTATGSAA